MSRESYNDYKLVVSNTLTSREVSFIMVTDTRQGLWVRHIQAREPTVMKNKCGYDLPSHNDKIFNPSRWKDSKRWRRERRSFSCPDREDFGNPGEITSSGRNNGNGEVKKSHSEVTGC